MSNNCREGERGGLSERELFFVARIEALVERVRFLTAALEEAQKEQWDGEDVGERSGN